MVKDDIQERYGHFWPIGVEMKKPALMILALISLAPTYAQSDILDEIAKGGTARPLGAYMEGKRQREEEERENARLELERQRVAMERERLREEQRLERERLQLQEEQMRFRMDEAKSKTKERTGAEGQLELLEKLELLGKLRDDKVISVDEFNTLKADVMAKYGPNADEN